jgi:hypothetical protein
MLFNFMFSQHWLARGKLTTFRNWLKCYAASRKMGSNSGEDIGFLSIFNFLTFPAALWLSNRNEYQESS